jgi:hypothetical protein
LYKLEVWSEQHHQSFQIHQFEKEIKMKIIFFVLAASLAIALATPTPEAEAEADPQYDLTEAFMDPYGELDQYTDEALDADLGDVELRRRRHICCRRPWLRRCRHYPRHLCHRWGK